jgi:hypothetical protein
MASQFLDEVDASKYILREIHWYSHEQMGGGSTLYMDKYCFKWKYVQTMTTCFVNNDHLEKFNSLRSQSWIT